MKKLFIAASLVASTFLAFAQTKSFEGVVTYSMNIDGELDPVSASMMQNKEMVMFIKNDKSRTESDMGVAKITWISDAKNETATQLMDVMGQKFAIKMTKEDLDKQKQNVKDPKINYLNETKDIAGYTCKKAQIKVDGSDDVVNVYYTAELGGDQHNQFKGLKGFPLEYDMVQQGLKMTFTAKSVKKEKVDDSKFAIPSDYQQMTAEEMKAMFGQGQ